MDKYSSALEQYEKKFNDSFPSMSLAISHNEEKIIKIIGDCISKCKDVYDIGYLSIEDDIKY